MKKAVVIFLVLSIISKGSPAFHRARGAFNPPCYPLEEKSVELLGTKIVYVEGGSGKPLIFIHGVGGALLDWEKVLPYFAKTYNVIALDLPGFGKSEKKMDYPYSIATNAKIVIALMDAKNIEKAYIVGNSMGGEVSAYLAIHYPDRVEKLVLVDSAGALKLTYDPFSALFVYIFAKPLYSLSVRSGINDPHSSDPERVKPNIAKAIYESDEWWGTREAWRDNIVDIFSLRLKKDLKKISAPTLEIWGDKDNLLPFYDKWTFWERIPNSELLIIPGADHTPQLSKPREFEIAVDNFLQGKPNPNYKKRGEKVRLK